MRGFFIDPSRADDCFIPFKDNLIFTLIADHGDTNPGWRVARYQFDNSKGIYKKIKCTSWSHNYCQLFINDTNFYGNIEYDLLKTNITISLVDTSDTNVSATFVLYTS